MQPNPYEPPASSLAYRAPYLAPPVNRMPFVLAAAGAVLASVYWAALTILLGLGVLYGSTSPANMLMPCVLIGLYAYRGVQLYRGDRLAARRILWLHGVGGVVALITVFTGSGLPVVLHGIKVAIHVFGAIAALRVVRLPETPVESF